MKPNAFPSPRFQTLTMALASCALALCAFPDTSPAQGLHVGPDRTDPQRADLEPARNSPSPRLARSTPARPGPAPAGIITKSLSIRAEIEDGVATTELSQVFHNTGRQPGEAVWILPLPNGAIADHFTMTMNGRQVRGEVLDADQARSIYTGIVRRQRDPGLLEYMGNGCLRARVFPIPPRQDMRIEVRYRQVLPETAGIHQWRFPLRAAKANGRLPARTTLDLRIRSRRALKNVYSPNAAVDVHRQGDHQARVSLELSNHDSLTRDLDVFYGISDEEFGLDLLTFRERNQAGYFVMMLSPKLVWDTSKTLPKCINFVIDTSGSMQGEKIAQARNALKFFLNSLNEKDHFNVIPFSTQPRPLFRKLVRANPNNVQKALAASEKLVARGGTNIHGALTTALAAEPPSRQKKLGITVFLTDGRANVGQTVPSAILADVRSKNRDKHRIFVFGVGDDVNANLLDAIAKQSHGDRDYVRPGESIEIKTGALFSKLSHPVMSDVRIDCAGIEGFDIYPKTTPNLFKGSRLLLTGRFKGHGSHAIVLRGRVDGQEKEFVYEGSFPRHAEKHDFIPTLWAQRKIAMLLDHIRLNGAKKELIDEVRRLGQEHGIVTPHSSHLILERHARRRVTTGHGGRFRGPRDSIPPRGSGPRTVGSSPGVPGVPGAAGPMTPGPSTPGSPGAGYPRTTTGSDEFFMGSRYRSAIDYSIALRKLAKSRKVVGGEATRRIGGRTMHDIDGVWVDAGFKSGMEKKARAVKAFSKEYFELLKKHKLAKILALGPRVIVVITGRAIVIG